jgi:hypothetical protein
MFVEAAKKVVLCAIYRSIGCTGDRWLVLADAYRRQTWRRPSDSAARCLGFVGLAFWDSWLYMFSAHACKYGSAGQETARQCSRLLTCWWVSGFLFICVYWRPRRDKSRRACMFPYATAYTYSRTEILSSLYTLLTLNSKEQGYKETWKIVHACLWLQYMQLESKVYFAITIGQINTTHNTYISKRKCTNTSNNMCAMCMHILKLQFIICKKKKRARDIYI